MNTDQKELYPENI